MVLDDVAILAADTSRSKAYIQALVRNGLHPAHVYLLYNQSSSALPGQVTANETQVLPNEIVIQHDSAWAEAGFRLSESLEITLKRASIPFSRLENGDINSEPVVNAVSAICQPVLIYSGYGGVLLRKPLLATGKKFLHIHGGYLPAFKGSTTNYYSLIAEGTLGASSIFLTENIDGGPILVRKTFPAPPDRTRIDHVYDSAARADVLVETLRRYARSAVWELSEPNNVGGETYFIIHPVLKHIAILTNEAKA